MHTSAPRMVPTPARPLAVREYSGFSTVVEGRLAKVQTTKSASRVKRGIPWKFAAIERRPWRRARVLKGHGEDSELAVAFKQVARIEAGSRLKPFSVLY
jgi:hypothetical protein